MLNNLKVSHNHKSFYQASEENLPDRNIQSQRAQKNFILYNDPIMPGLFQFLTFGNVGALSKW